MWLGLLLYNGGLHVVGGWVGGGAHAKIWCEGHSDTALYATCMLCLQRRAYGFAMGGDGQLLAAHRNHTLAISDMHACMLCLQRRAYGFVMGGDGKLLAAHVVYILVIATWVCGIMAPFFLLLKRLGCMRVPPGG